MHQGLHELHLLVPLRRLGLQLHLLRGQRRLLHDDADEGVQQAEGGEHQEGHKEGREVGLHLPEGVDDSGPAVQDADVEEREHGARQGAEVVGNVKLGIGVVPRAYHLCAEDAEGVDDHAEQNPNPEHTTQGANEALDERHELPLHAQQLHHAHQAEELEDLQDACVVPDGERQDPAVQDAHPRDDHVQVVPAAAEVGAAQVPDLDDHLCGEDEGKDLRQDIPHGVPRLIRNVHLQTHL
mmetsp:Transcript_58012/g.186360  ORF Transcript_58012/g.186360 Transcript_58012/m.186360 type:complete len:239 (-) Transcript_58012:341-1057(-)